MITDKDLQRIKCFQLDEDGNYSDWEDWLIVPKNKARKEWIFYAHSCVDGHLTEMFDTIMSTEFMDFMFTMEAVTRCSWYLDDEDPVVVRNEKMKTII